MILTDDFLPKSVNAQNPLTLNKITETQRVLDQIIHNLDPVSIYSLMQGGSKDIDDLFNLLFDQTYNTLFGSTGVKDIGFNYIEKLNDTIEETYKIEDLAYFIATSLPDFNLKWYHLEWCKFILLTNKLCILASRDAGKCFSPDTKVRMGDGTIKKIVDINVGDKVMGADGKPKKVIHRHVGIDDMYWVHQKRAMSYKVNSRHTLHYRRNGTIIHEKDVCDWIEMSNNAKKNCYGYRLGFDLPEQNLPLDPYLLGVWLGDGNRDCQAITCPDTEVIDYLKNWADENDMIFVFKDNIRINIKNKKAVGGKNKLFALLKGLKVINNKHIPKKYLTGSKEQRLQLLAGLLDTDGHFNRGRTYEFSSIYERLAKDFKNLCNGLGFRCSLKKIIKRNFNIGNGVILEHYEFYSMNVTGDLYQIPCKVARKKCIQKEKGGVKNFQNSEISVEPAGKGVYVGITLAENPLFLLEDGTVVHNSYFFSNAYPIWKMYRYKPLLAGEVNPRKDLNLSKRGFIMTNELDLGVELLAILKDTIESSDVLKDKLYSGKSDSWSKTSITTKNSCKLTVKSYGGSFRGRHPGYIVLDDYLRENVLYSSIQRDKSNNYFSATIMNALLKQGQGIIVGTPMHEQDIYGVLKKKKNWTVLEYPAIFPDGTILDPDRYSYEDLMEIKEDQGSLIFTRERLVKPIMNDTSIFNEKFMKKAIKGMEEYTLVRNRESFPKDFLYVVVGVDLAISASASADYSFYTVWGVDENYHMWLIYVWRKKGAGYNEQLNALKTINDNFGADLFCIETNQFQAVIGNGAQELGLNVFQHHTGENKYNFKYGLPAVATFFEKGKFHLPYGDEYSKFVADLIISEFTSIIWTPKGLEGAGAHDDGAMSTWKAFAGLCELDKDFI